ncbi:MAG: helix-turn-helix domain-containing protein [Vicinamibacteria bacterium]
MLGGHRCTSTVAPPMLGDRVRLSRRKAALSPRDLSATTGGKVTAQAIGTYERGERVPRSGVLVALARVLHVSVSVSYLLDTQGIDLTGVEFRTTSGARTHDRARRDGGSGSGRRLWNGSNATCRSSRSSSLLRTG